ncbi:MAG: hypothetical protein ABIO70_16790 [Pseudomonadota bacterium]
MGVRLAHRDLSPTRDPLPRWAWLAVGLVAALFGAVVLRSAWLADDCFFSLRPAWNLLHGYGLRYNVAERVQGFTSPLWTLLLAGQMAAGANELVACVGSGVVLSVVAALLLARWVAPGPAAALLVPALLVSSKAFVDFSAAALENPLAHALYALVLVVLLGDGGGRRRPLVLGTLGSLLMLTRLDLALVVAPALLATLLPRPSRPVLQGLLLGGLPLVAWELFSLVYYRAPVPCTAVAKLGDLGLDRGFLVHRGWASVVDTLAWDRVTVPVILLGTLAALVGRRPRELQVLAGVFAYLGYLVWIGGDFMAGRFLTVPFLGAVALLVVWLGRRPALAALALPAVLVLSATSPRSPLRVGVTYEEEHPPAELFLRYGVADERMFHYRLGAGRLWREVGWSGTLRGEAPPEPRWVAVVHSGQQAYYDGPGLHAIQIQGLTDPLLARMPPTGEDLERAGHAYRTLPRGYLASLESGENQIADPRVAALWDDLVLVSRGPLWTRARWEAIGRLLGGRYAGLVHASIAREAG